MKKLFVRFKRVAKIGETDAFTAKNRGLSIFGDVSRGLKHGQRVSCILVTNCAGRIEQYSGIQTRRHMLIGVSMKHKRLEQKGSLGQLSLARKVTISRETPTSSDPSK